jgi:glucokinase
MSPEPYVLGADLGGTQLRVAAVTLAGRLASQVHSAPTGKAFGPDELRRALPDLAERVRSGLPGREPEALGFGTPGVVVDGPLSQCDNLPLLNGVKIQQLVRDAVAFPVALENDARCYVLAEARFGAGRGVGDVCGISLGTGVGCGLMLDGRLYRGHAGQAGEVWRIPLRGRPVEHFLSGEGLVRSFLEAGGRGGLDAAGVEAAARAGDEAALAAWRAFGEDLAFLCACVIAVHDPALIVLGGSLSSAHDLYDGVLASQLEGLPTRVAKGELGGAAGVIGAAALTMNHAIGN